MKTQHLLTVVVVATLWASATPVRAAGDLSRQTPVDMRVQLGDEKGVRHFFPD